CVGRLRRKNRIVGAHGPIDVLNFDFQIGSSIDQPFRPFGRLLDMSDTLIGEGYESNIGRHLTLFPGSPNNEASPHLRKIAKATGFEPSVPPLSAMLRPSPLSLGPRM